MRHFLMVFDEKEGTTPVVRLLDKFEHVSMLHRVGNRGWEPFDRHTCGPIDREDFRRCLDMIFGPEPVDMLALNRVYTRTSRGPLKTFSKDGAVGFKMRFRPPYSFLPALRRLPILGGFMKYQPVSSTIAARLGAPGFTRLMLDVLSRNRVVTFVVVRQDILRWALSKYHGDGSGKKGHLQFALARGAIRREEIPKITVDCRRFAKLVRECERIHEGKTRLMGELTAAGVDNYVLLYEDFVDDAPTYFEKLLRRLELETTPEEISRTLYAGAEFEKVHSSDISTFVNNYEEVLAQFDDRYRPWC